MRYFSLLGGLILTVALSGCGGGGLSEGVPDKVDLTKTYTPPGKVGGMTPGDQRKAIAAQKKAAADAPPAPTEK